MAYVWSDENMLKDWNEANGARAGPSAHLPPTSYSTSGLQPRRLSAATRNHNIPPAPPAPTQPIPRVPSTMQSPEGRNSSIEVGYSPPSYHSNGMFRGSNPTSTSMPSPQYGQGRKISTRVTLSRPDTAESTSSVGETLDSPPPASAMRRAPISARGPNEDYQNDRTLLAPPSNPMAEARASTRPSSRRALTRALELAREAVNLDSNSDDPYAAVEAYGRSVALLSEVMERVRRGEDSTESSKKRAGRRRSAVAQEEEVRRLKSIHDTYADRMNILSLIYNIAPTPHSPTTVYNSPSTVTTRPPSPVSGTSTDDDTSDPIPRTPLYITEHFQNTAHHFMEGGLDNNAEHDDMEAIGSAMFGLESPTVSSSLGRRGSDSSDSSPHPYAAPILGGLPEQQQQRRPSAPPPQTYDRNQIASLGPRAGSFSGRRTSNALQPAAPPPVSSLPAAPPSNQRHTDIDPRQRHAAPGHRAAPLWETNHDRPMYMTRQSVDMEEAISPRSVRPSARLQSSPPSDYQSGLPSAVARNTIMKSPPPSLSIKPRGDLSPPPSPKSTTHATDQLINSSTIQGTISQRRNKTGSTKSSPIDAPASPPTTAKPLSGPVNRNRSSSQPGRRPDLDNSQVSPGEARPPLPPSASYSRKPSHGSKSHVALNSPPQLKIQTELSPPNSAYAYALPAHSMHLPMTPTSPLPPVSPPDAMRKPYHMMGLVRATMTSKTGGYLTRRLHVPQEVWSQGGAKLTNVLEKVRVIEVLCAAMDELSQYSTEHFGAGNLSAGINTGVTAVSKRSADGWNSKLEEFSSICDGVVASFGKKLNVGEGFVLKKHGGMTSWGGKLKGQFEKLTNQKSLDSPAAYVAGLSKLFANAQLLDDHTKAILTQPLPPLYSSFPADVRTSAELKLKRSSEFFATVVLTFVIRDLSQLLDKYSKRCSAWINE